MTDRWDCHFLQLALDCARMSKDPSTGVGAVIVGEDGEVMSTGFNGFPRGIEDSAERLNDRDAKLRLIVHGEMNAILAAARNGVRIKGCTLYLAATGPRDDEQIWGGPPCVRCTVELIQAGIAEVVSYPMKSAPSRWADDIEFARKLLAEAGVAYREVPLATQYERDCAIGDASLRMVKPRFISGDYPPNKKPPPLKLPVKVGLVTPFHDPVTMTLPSCDCRLGECLGPFPETICCAEEFAKRVGDPVKLADLSGGFDGA